MEFIVDLNDVPYDFCPMCKYDKISHSFHQILETNEEIYYYTCPSDATHYDDTDGIISHLHHELEICHKKNKKWVWLFSCYNFGLKHMVQIKQVRRFINFLYPRYTYMLQNIYILHLNTIFRSFYNTIYYFIPEILRKLIIIPDVKKFNIEVVRDNNLLFIQM